MAKVKSPSPASSPAQPQPFIVIIAGGKGERFWPQSRAARPKHLLPVVGETPLLSQTLTRVKALAPAKNTFVITSAIQAKEVARICRGLIPPANIVAEPTGRDTAAAVGLAAALVGARDPNGVFAVLPADHVIHDTKAYQADLRAAIAAAGAAEVMVTIGIPPSEPATGFGYIQRGEEWARVGAGQTGKVVYEVKRFVEKPKLELAEAYLKSGDYVWNAGMFVWSVPVVEAAFEAHAPDLDAGLKKIRTALKKKQPLKAILAKIYPTLVKISVDYALLEKSANVVMLPASFDWDDVGAWPAVAKHFKADSAGNVRRGEVIIEQGSGNIVFGEGGHLVTLLGVHDLVVVHTKDATLVMPKAKAQEIKALLTQVGARKDAAKRL
ncbi:MAG: mannose-1-phosphate guanyltransferase [Verrucomicrobia bacterium]|nr:MAG: mannose-1-phosphate guanyltransferase [Verrucomicrobiota bacterium]